MDTLSNMEVKYNPIKSYLTGGSGFLICHLISAYGFFR